MEGLLAAGLAVIFILFVICIAYIVFYIIGMVKLYKKCGRDGWMAIVPFYNVYILTEIAGLEWYWFLMAIASTIIAVVSDSSAISGLASLVSTFTYVNIAYNLAKKMHKDTAWGILTGIFSGIMFPIIGFMNSLVYDPNVPVSKNGFFDSDKVVGPQPGPMGPQPGPMGPQPGPMGPQPGPMGPQPGPMGPQPGPMGPQSGPMGPQSGQVQNQPTDNNINNF